MSATDRDNSTQCEALPTVTVVICSRNRPESLIDTLRSLRTQRRRADEVLILDDGALSAADCERIGTAASEAAAAWKIIPTGGIGLTASRNLAARNVKGVKGDILLFLDDDVTCEAQVVEEIARLMQDPLVSGVTATVIEPAFHSLPARLFQRGYALAGWWRIAPRGRPPGPKPNALHEPSIAVRARWLSGAAMALRRSVVLAHPFDESLAAYALGEDREMGYRLAPNHWLLESRRARVVHRRDAGSRTDAYRLGLMTARNYIYILKKTCNPGFGDWLLIAWSFLVLSMMHTAWGLAGRSAHWAELRGLMAGVWQTIRLRMTQRGEIGCLRNRLANTTPSAGDKEPIAKANDAQNSPSEPASPFNGKPLRALFVTNRLTHGGAERMLLTLVKRLPDFGVTPVIACLQEAGPLAVECAARGIVVHGGILHHKTDVAVILRLRQIIESADIDVVVVAHSGGDRMFWPTLAAAVDDIPVVVWSHWFPRSGIAHIERPNRALYRFIDAFVALGDAHKSSLVRHEHVPAGRISIIRNGIELERFERQPPREVLRCGLDLKPHEIGIGLIANLRPEKRQDLFIQAAARLAPDRRHLRFFLIGDGPDRHRVASLVQDAGLPQATLSMLGARDDTPELLRALDIACLCSDVECMPVVMLEAAAAGCAFIGPNVGCVPEFLTHRENGLVINASDPAGLADAISELSADSALRHRLTESAARRVHQGFDAADMSRDFARLLRKCVIARRGHERGQGRPNLIRQIPEARPIVSAVP